MVDTREAKTVRLPPELWQRVSVAASENRRSDTREIEVAVEEYLRLRSQAGIMDGLPRA